MFLVLTMIILVAALNIISGLIMLVKDKGHDIAILRTMGATRGAIQRVFFITGAAIGVAGTSGGFILGLVICLNVESIRQFIQWLSGVDPFNAELYYLSQLPADIDSSQTIWIVLMSLVLSFRATLYPVVAGRTARSGRSAEVRMMAAPRQPALELRHVARSYAEGKGRLESFST